MRRWIYWLAALFALAVLAAAWPGDYTWMLRDGEVKAAWAQAILSVAAIAASTWLWHSDQRIKRREDYQQKKAREFREALRLHPVFAQATGVLRRVRAAVPIESSRQSRREVILSALLHDALEEFSEACDRVSGCSHGFEVDIVQSGAIAGCIASVMRAEIVEVSGRFNREGLSFVPLCTLSVQTAQRLIDLLDAIDPMIDRSKATIAAALGRSQSWL